MQTITLTHAGHPDRRACSCCHAPAHTKAEHDLVSRLADYRVVCRHCGLSPQGLLGCSCSAPVDRLAELDGVTVRIETAIDADGRHVVVQ